MEDMKFSKNLKEYLITEGISMNELSRKMEVPVSTVHGWLNGVEPKSIHDLKKVSNFLGVSLDDLCFGDARIHLETDLHISIGKHSYKILLSKVEKAKV
jgi:transcriptional regulator with XRE-family HTH domain